MTFQDSIIVRNKDIPLLSRVLYIMQDISMLEKKRDFQIQQSQNITQHLSFTPGAKGKTGGIDDIISALSEIETEHEALVEQYTHDLRTAENIINGITSYSMRVFVNMRYCFDMPKKTIMKELGLSRWGYERAVRAVEEAPNMASVKWSERYILIDEKGHFQEKS